MKRRYTIGLVTVVALVGLACSSGSGNDEASAAVEASEETQNAAAPLGEPIDNGDVIITVDNLVFGVESDTGFESKNGSFAVVEVSIEVTADKYIVAATSWQLTAEDGTTYTAEAIVPGIEGVLEFQQLSSGQKTSGKVVFDVDESVFDDGEVTVTHTHTLNDPITWSG